MYTFCYYIYGDMHNSICMGTLYTAVEEFMVGSIIVNVSRFLYSIVLKSDSTYTCN